MVAELLITGGTVITMDPRRRIIDDGAVAVEGDRIVDVGPRDEVEGRFGGGRVIDARRKAVMPGLVDTHGHALGLIKAVGEHLHTDDWVRIRHFAEFRGQTEESFRVEGLLSALERLKFGTTFGVSFIHRVDDDVFASRNAQAVEEVGIRGIVALGPLVDLWPKAFSLWRGERRADRLVDLDEAYQVCESFVEKWPRRAERRVFGWLSTSNLSSRSNEKVADIHREVKRIADESGVGISTHGSGGDVKRSFEGYNILGPRTLIVHATGLSEEEVQILKRTDTKVSHCPSVLGFMASSYTGGPTWPPIVEMIDAGVTVGLGTDGPTGRITNFDMFKELNMGMMLQRLRFGNRYVMPPGKVLEMATIDAARALGVDVEVGSLEPGKKADITIVNMYKPHLTPTFMIPYRLTYEAQGQDVETVVVDGEVVMENRVVKTVDEQEILDRAQGEAETLIERCGLRPWMRLARNFWGQSRY